MDLNGENIICAAPAVYQDQIKVVWNYECLVRSAKELKNLGLEKKYLIHNQEYKDISFNEMIRLW